MSASSIMDITGTWCNKFGEEQLKVLKGCAIQSKIKRQLVQYWKSHHRRMEAHWSPKRFGTDKKPVFDITIMTKNGVIFCVYLWKDHEISAILATTSVTMSIEKAHIMTGHHDEE